MKEKKAEHLSIILYFLVLTLFTIFFIYMALFENSSVKIEREPDREEILSDVKMVTAEDTSAPAGIRQEYTFTLENIAPGDYLSIYLVHQYAQISLDGEPIYNLLPKLNSRTGKSAGCNIISIPLSVEDENKEVKAVITPAYDIATNGTVTFIIAPPIHLMSIFLKSDLPKFIIAGLCLILGITMIVVQLFLIFRKRTKSWDIFYLGNFTLLLGIWKFFDVPLISLLFDNNTKALSYISIGAMYISVIPMTLYVRDHAPYKNRMQMTAAALISSAASLIALALQLTNIMDLREGLLVFQCVIVLNAVNIITVFVSSLKQNQSQHSKLVFIFTIPFAAALLADIITFYNSNGITSVTFTAMMLLVYSVTFFIRSMIDINKKAFVDIHTGLYNKNYWDLILDEDWNCETAGIIVIDINNLKYVNDTYGHDAGDKLIYDFSKILSRVVLEPNVLCRWGGDEFTCLIRNAAKQTLENSCNELANLVAAYNSSNKSPIKIYYAIGYALSSEFPNQTKQDLVHVADSRMYENKRCWYEKCKPDLMAHKPAEQQSR